MLSIIAAMTDERVIGRNNRLPWRLPEDLKHFKKVTMGSPVIMGRKTFDSITRALPGRRNIVITRDPNYAADGAEVAHSLEEAIDRCEESQEIFVIGGGEIFRLALPKADRLYLTFIHKRFEGDAYFPEFDLEKSFRITSKTTHETAGKPPFTYSFITAERK